MINLHVSLNNPFSTRFENVKCWYGPISKHKAWEVQIVKSNTILTFTLYTRLRQDHEGFDVTLGILGYELLFNFYDTRHLDAYQ